MDSTSPKRPPPPPPPENEYHTDARDPQRVYHQNDRPFRSQHHPYAPNYSRDNAYPREGASYHRDPDPRDVRDGYSRDIQGSFREGGPDGRDSGAPSYSREPRDTSSGVSYGIYGREAAASYGGSMESSYRRDGDSRDHTNYGNYDRVEGPTRDSQTTNGYGRPYQRGPGAAAAGTTGTHGNRSTSPRRTGPTEFRMSIDTSAFPVEMNAIAQILGPRGKHQQRMKGEADAIVTLVGKGVRGHGPDEPLCLVIKSRSNIQPLTKRQIAAVQAIYDHILLHARQFKTTDNMSGTVAIPNTGPPETYVEAVWFLHQLLIVPRPFDLEVGEIFHAYKEHYGYECPLDKWLGVNLGDTAAVAGAPHLLPVNAALALQRALEKLPHVVDLYHQGEENPWRVRGTNAPDIMFATFRELDEVYRMKIAELASKGENEKIKTYTAVLQAIYRLLLERCVDMNGSLSLDDLVGEYHQIYRQDLDVYEAFQEPALLKFIQRFPSLFSVFYDGQHWRAAPVLAASAAVDSTVERAVHQFLVMPRKPRIHVRLASIVPLPPKLGGPASANSAGHAPASAVNGGGGSSAVSNLVALLQSARAAPPATGGFTVVGMPKSQPAEATTVAPAAGPSVTAQIQELLKKKKEQSAAASMGGPLDGLLNALKKK
jgi:hypothetical protein